MRDDTRRGDSGREAIRRVRAVDAAGAERSLCVLPFEPLPTDGEVRAWVRGFAAGKATAIGAGGKGVGRGC
jgi:hypothetical protein